MKKLVLLSLAIICLSFNELKAQEPFLGEVKMFAGNFAPRGWMLCEGQLLSINQHQALFSILGTMYGGDGRTTFALPDLRGRVAVGVGNGPGLSDRRQGSKFGSESVTLTTNNLPAHSHDVAVYSSDNSSSSSSDYIKGTNSVIGVGNKSKTTNTTSTTGNQQSINNVQPSLSIRYIICVTGIFPSRN